MGWQAGSDSRRGGAPGPGERLPGLPAGFEHGGAWGAVPPSAALAGALEAAAGPDGLYDGAGIDALVGIARQWAAVESWAAAGLLGSLRAMMREDGEGRPLLRRRSDLPGGWDDSLAYEVAQALAMGPVSAGNLAGLAWTLGFRLPGIGRLLADGTLTRAKAKLVAQVFEPLSEDEAARAEALIVSEVAGKTYFQVERLAWRAALAVAPDVAERRRVKAEGERARVTVFREESGAVCLSGRDLPAAQALSGHASVVDRARQYEACGAFPGQGTSSLQALAYLHLLNGVAAADAIAFARSASAEPPDSGVQGEDGSGGPGGDQDPDDREDPSGGGGPDSGDGPAPAERPSGGEDAGGGPGPGGANGPVPGGSRHADDNEDPGGGSGPGGGPGPDGADGPGPGGGRPGHHRHEVSTYQPSDRLRRLVQVRDHECTFPTCSRPARESDFEHAVPYDKGGRTDACNAGARSRRCHQVKQSPGWTVTQPKPGWHAWTTPTGRTYVQPPWRYIA